MGFYYLSIFSIMLLLVIYAVLFLLYLGVARVTRGMLGRKVVLVVVGVTFLLLPIGEEVWIGWNFGQACKQAGTFIYKKVQVEGFYDDTTGWGPRQLSASKYEFMESRDILARKLIRVEPASDAARDRAIAWYAEENPGKEKPKDLFIVQPLNGNEKIIVSPDGRRAWRQTIIDRPTARYWFKHTDPMNGTQVAHKVGRSGSVVVDSQTNEEIARYTSFGREPPWYWVSLGVPPYACDAPGRWPNTRGTALVYREALISASDKK